ncbi:MAG: C40 family peptidase [Candidatus Magasanikbacteria bacterium]|nr:C40 family peptidase [Candidatus Magasanikbacteria bacterium]
MPKHYRHLLPTIVIFFIIALAGSPFAISRAWAATNNSTNIQDEEGDDIKIRAPEPRISIPGLQFTPPEDLTRPDITREGDQRNVLIDIPYLAQYIAAVYRYAVAIASLLAVVMIIVAGFQWTISAGNTDMVSSARKRLGGAIIGLIIAVGSYALLYTINPELVNFSSLKIQYIKTKDLKYYFGGDTSDDVRGDALQRAQSLNLYCPQTSIEAGKRAVEMEKIAESLHQRVLYRFGGKGVPPPTTGYADEKIDEFKYSCPSGYMCFDCSGFANFFLKCAGISPPGGGTANIFAGSQAEAIKPKPGEDGEFDIDYEKNAVNGTALQPGDLLGWKQADQVGKSAGHVVVYIGNGKTIESAGQARSPGTDNPFVKNLADLKGHYPLRWVWRAPK